MSDGRPVWDQLLDDAPHEWARAARDTADSLYLATAILRTTLPETTPPFTAADVVRLTEIILARHDRETGHAPHTEGDDADGA